MNLFEWLLIFLVLISISTFVIVIDIFHLSSPNLGLSNEDINKFAKKSLKEYLSSYSGSYHLCNGSNTFSKVWNKHSHQIKELGQEFLEETELKAKIGDMTLFHCQIHEDRYRIRVTFLEWLIKKD